jgi:hypothetical protein
MPSFQLTMAVRDSGVNFTNYKQSSLSSVGIAEMSAEHDLRELPA